MSIEGYLQTRAGEVFYEWHGEEQGVPLVCMHGGPGFTSHYLEPIDAYIFPIFEWGDVAVHRLFVGATPGGAQA